MARFRHYIPLHQEECFLDNNTIQTLKSVMNEVLDEKLSGFKTELVDTMDKKLESLENRMDEKLESLENRMDEKLEKLENKMVNTMDEKLRDSENLLLEEMERTRTILEDKISIVQKNVDDLNQYYRVARLESDNLSLVIGTVQNLTKRVEELERKTA